MLRVLMLLCCFVPLVAKAGDWPQILGPTRTGVAENETLADKWPKSGPAQLWQYAVGEGFAGVAVVGQKAIVFHRIDDDEVAEALDASTGKRLWKHTSPTSYQPSFINDSGPRVVPLVHEDRIYLYGARGKLTCLTLDAGKQVWQRDLYADFSGKRPIRGEPPEGYFGFGSSPIVEGDKLLLNVGGTNEAGIVAFSLKNGETVWKSTTERASYSSPIAATLGGQRQVIFATRLKLLSVDPKDGKVLWEFPFGQLGPAVTAANPIVFGDRVIISASYGFGAKSVRVTNKGVTEEWNSDELLSSQYTTSVPFKDWLVGVHGRQDGGPVSLRKLDPVGQKASDLEPSLGYATLIRANDRLLLLKTSGELVLGKLGEGASFTELGTASLFGSGATCRALPALSNGRLYVRDEKTLKCFSLK